MDQWSAVHHAFTTETFFKNNCDKYSESILIWEEWEHHQELGREVSNHGFCNKQKTWRQYQNCADPGKHWKGTSCYWSHVVNAFFQSYTTVTLTLPLFGSNKMDREYILYELQTFWILCWKVMHPTATFGSQNYGQVKQMFMTYYTRLISVNMLYIKALLVYALF